MIVIIDGYNLLKQVFHKVKGKLDRQRNRLVAELGLYKKKKYPEVKEVVLVFDGGLSSHADRQVHNGIVVVFSGQKKSADDWIFDFIKKHKNSEVLLITNDRELISRCNMYGADAIGVFDFYDIVKNTISNDAIHNFRNKNSSRVIKYDTDFEIEDQLRDFCNSDGYTLDVLMSHADLDFNNADELYEKNIKKDKVSKKEKRIYRKIKKL